MRYVVEIAMIGSVFWCTSLSAQPIRECNPNTMCRTMYHFGKSSAEDLELGCGPEIIPIEGIVMEIQQQDGKCTRIIVSTETQENISDQIAINMSSCVVWSGQVGEMLRGFVRRDPSNPTWFDAVAYCTR